MIASNALIQRERWMFGGGMTLPCKFERSLLSFDEYETIAITHHPTIQTLDGDTLRAIVTRLREMRDRERTHARQKRRESRGKAETRGASFPGTFEKPRQRKQVFSAALKRTSKELARRNHFEARAATMDAAHRALALRRSTHSEHRPPSEKNPHHGMTGKVSRKRARTIPPSAIGSITHATQIAQAVRDGRG
jgi:hypothetical protein